jgi:hypothetical protein
MTHLYLKNLPFPQNHSFLKSRLYLTSHLYLTFRLLHLCLKYLMTHSYLTFHCYHQYPMFPMSLPLPMCRYFHYCRPSLTNHSCHLSR